MANRLGSLVVSLGLDAAEFTRGLTKGEYEAAKFVRGVENAISAARASMATLGVSALAAAGAVASVARDIANYQGLAETVGDSAEAMASLQRASSSSETSLDSVAAASVKLTTALGKVDDEGDDVARAIKALGIDFEAFKRQSPVAQLDEVARAMAGFESSADKTRVATMLFGKSGAELIGFLNDLGEATERTSHLTNEQIQASDDFAKTLASLQGDVQRFAQTMAADAVPALTSMVEMLREAIRYASDASTGTTAFTGALAFAKTVLETFVIVGSDVGFVFRMIGREVGGIAAQLAALARGDIQGFHAISDAMRDDAARARRELDRFQREILSPTSYSADNQSEAESRRLGMSKLSGRLVAPPVKGKKEKEKKEGLTDEQRALDSYVTGLLRQQQALQNLTAEEEALIFLRQQGAAGEVQQVRELVLGMAAELDMAQELAAQRKLDQEALKSMAEAEKKAADAQKDRLAALRANTDIGRQAAELDDLLFAYQEYTAGRITSELEYDQVVKGILDRNKENVQTVKTFAEEMGLSFTSAFERAAEQGRKFKDLLKGLAKDFLMIGLRRGVTEPLGKAATGLFDKFFSSFEGGGYTGSGARSGGMDGRGGYLAMVHPNETVVDHTRGGSVGGVSISQNFDFRGASTDAVAMLRAEASRIKAETLAAVFASADRGGSAAARLGRA